MEGGLIMMLGLGFVFGGLCGLIFIVLLGQRYQEELKKISKRYQEELNEISKRYQEELDKLKKRYQEELEKTSEKEG
jgi:Skp family chaperone for outer membrane proteins